MSDPRPLTVAALTRRIQDCLAGLGGVLVQGELTQVKVATSGHLYATLKDGDAVVSVVMWRSSLVRNGQLPAEGSQVLVQGQVEVYAPRGSYQLIARSIRPIGAGELAARFEALKERLRGEGLFDPACKKPLPFLPRAVGIATAAGSAALADLLSGLRARFPALPIVLAPCRVQGAGAAADVVRALSLLTQHPLVDVIIVGRGGGSLEDLWAFNEEPLVRAVAACTTPVIAAIGHETDTTLCDLVADLRAKTPTMAAELAVPVAAELRQRVEDLREAATAAMLGMLRAARQRLDTLTSHRALAGPGYRLQSLQQRLDELSERLMAACRHRVDEANVRQRALARQLAAFSPSRRLAERQRELRQLLARARQLAQALSRGQQQRLEAAAGRLHALSPLAVLGRGYAMLRDEAGAVVASVAQATPGQRLRGQVQDGELQLRVEADR